MIDFRKVRQNIYVEENALHPHFVGAVRSTLDRLEETSTGRRLIEKIGSTTHRVFINHAKDPCVTFTEQDSFVYHPEPSSGYHYIATNLSLIPRPSSAVLAHELIHVYHHTKGKLAPNAGRSDGMVWSNDEEYHTIMGFSSKKIGRTIPKITENAILSEMGLPERFSHLASATEELNTNSILRKRIELAAKIYNDRCLELNYTGQARNPPPPIINCRGKDLAPSNRWALVYTTNDSEKSEWSCKTNIHFVDVTALPIPLPSEDFDRVEIDPDQCPPGLQLKKMIPSKAAEKVLSMGLYRLSALEAKELDKKASRWEDR